MTEGSDLRTAHAARSAQLKSTVDAALAGMFQEYAVDLTPTDESTGGGVRARQHLRLTTKDGRTLVVGWANAAEGTAELRTLGCTLEVSKERFGAELPIPAPEYARFVDRATDVLSVFGLQVSVVSTLRPSLSKPPPPR